MNPSDLVTPELIDQCRGASSIVIVGKTKSGKVSIAKKLAKELRYPLFISDDFINENDREGSLYTLMNAIHPFYNSKEPFIVEGILGYRLLRKGAQTGLFLPDILIQTKCKDETIIYFYDKEGEGHKIKHMLAFNKGLNKIWNEYMQILLQNPSIKRPKYIELDTTLEQHK